MSKTESTSHHISWLERAGDDFPFYNDSPTHIGTKNSYDLFQVFRQNLSLLCETRHILRVGIA